MKAIWNTLKSTLESKKFVTAFLLIIGGIAARKGFDVDTKTILALLAPGMVAIGAQGWADAGKESAKVIAGVKPPQGGFIDRGLLGFLAVFALVALIACGASTRQKTITTTLHALDTAEAAFVDFDGKHQLELVSASTSLADGQAKLASYRKDRDKVGQTIVFAYRAVAAAAQLDDDPSVSSMIQAAALVAQELATLGVKP